MGGLAGGPFWNREASGGIGGGPGGGGDAVEGGLCVFGGDMDESGNEGLDGGLEDGPGRRPPAPRTWSSSL